ncbi:MAG: hypothetical protein JWM20_911 [Patescibacteria group bacterium]|nr:hypothetical protein [Patescibacteria group bacterium]
MWQLYVLGSLFASATENVIEKASIIKNIAVDFFIASFWRPFLFFVVTALIGIIGVVGPLHFSFHWTILLLAPFGATASLFYTYTLKHVEITNASAIAYAAPIVFLFIDSKIFHNGFPFAVVAGIFLLVLGGIGFSLDATTRKLKSELTPKVWGILLFGLVWTGFEAYAFKYLNSIQGVNGVSFFASMWLLVSAILFVVVIAKGKANLLASKATFAYVKQSLMSKTLDATSTVLWAQAIAFATVAQVSALDALYPLIIFAMAAIVQGIFRVKLDEKLDRRHVFLKIIATIMLVAGAFLIGA